MKEQIYTKLYNNGIRLVHKHTDNIVAHIGIIINSGSRDENENEKGIAHLVEHTIFKGTKKRKAFHILSRIDNFGGEINAFTTKEETCVHASVMVEYYEKTIELLSDIIFNSTFPEKELAKEVDIIIDEIKSYKDNPAEQIIDSFEEQLFRGHPLANNPLGDENSITKYNSQNLLDFVRRTYNTDEIVVSSIGNIEFKKIDNIVSKYFGSNRSNLRNYKRIAFTNKVSKFFEKVSYNSYQVHCVLGNVAYDVRNEKRLPFSILSNILGGPMMNSRLNMNIREKYGHCYSIESQYTPLSDTGVFTIYFGTESKYYERVIDLIFKEIKKLQLNRLGTIQLARAKKQLIGMLAISQEAYLNDMLAIGKSFLLFNKVDRIDEINSKIEKITSTDIIECANEIMDVDKLSILIYNSKD